MRVRRPSVKRAERAQTLAEFAIVAPLLFLLIFGLVDMARLYQAYVTVQGAARDAARYGVTGQSDCAGASDRYACIQEVAEKGTSALANNATAVSVTARSWRFPGYTTANATGDPGQQCDLLQVSVSYDFKPATPLLDTIIGSVRITGREKMVNEPFGPCASS